jgi:hypothetical protein
MSPSYSRFLWIVVFLFLLIPPAMINLILFASERTTAIAMSYAPFLMFGLLGILLIPFLIAKDARHFLKGNLPISRLFLPVFGLCLLAGLAAAGFPAIHPHASVNSYDLWATFGASMCTLPTVFLNWGRPKPLTGRLLSWAALVSGFYLVLSILYLAGANPFDSNVLNTDPWRALIPFELLCVVIPAGALFIRRRRRLAAKNPK